MSADNMPDERVMAYVDGELDAVARAAFERELAADPDLRAAVEREQALRAALAAAYDPVLDEPVPPALQQALQPRVIDLAAAREARRPRWSWPEWGALAASLVLGLAFGVWGGATSFVRGESLLARSAEGGWLAQGTLARVLDEALAAEPERTPAGYAVGLSFETRDGRYCRSFALAAAPASTGLACRDEAGWNVLALAPAEAASGAYRQAATTLPATLLPLIERLREGEMLDAAGERAARGHGWR